MPLRTCFACRKVREKKELVRLAARSGALTVDIKGVLPGRGAYVCPVESCVKGAYKKREQFARSLKQKAQCPPIEELLAQVLKHSTTDK